MAKKKKKPTKTPTPHPKKRPNPRPDPDGRRAGPPKPRDFDPLAKRDYHEHEGDAADPHQTGPGT